MVLTFQENISLKVMDGRNILGLSFQKNIKPAASLVVALIDFQRAIHSIMIYRGALILNRMIFLMITTLRRYLNGGRILTQYFMQAVHNFLVMGNLQIT